MYLSIKQKQIFENGSNIHSLGECKGLSLIDWFEINDTTFYMVRYKGKFIDEEGKTVSYKYSCFFDGYEKAEVWDSELSAHIDALCLYQTITGKELPDVQ